MNIGTADFDIVIQLINSLKENIDFKKYDKIILLKPGGIYVGGFLGVTNYTIWEIDNFGGKTSLISYESIKNSKVLVIDDFCETGERFDIALRQLKKDGNEVETLVLHHHKDAKIKPTYSIKEVELMIVYPWTRFEKMKEKDTDL